MLPIDDKNHLHVAIRLESPLAGELDHAEMDRTEVLIHPQPFSKAFGLNKMGCGCFESQRSYKHYTSYVFYDTVRITFMNVATCLESPR